jgi:hypothetical protein
MQRWKICLFHIGVLMITLGAFSCKSSKGCPDRHARNFDIGADDSCCCEYNAYLVFWHNNTTAGNLYYFSGASTLTYFLDGKELGSQSVMRFVSKSPPCFHDSAFTAIIDLGTEKSRKSSYRVVGNNGITYWEGSLTLKADTCFKTRLVFKK